MVSRLGGWDTAMELRRSKKHLNFGKWLSVWTEVGVFEPTESTPGRGDCLPRVYTIIWFILGKQPSDLVRKESAFIL